MPLVQGIIDTQALPNIVGLVQSVVSPSVLANPYSGQGTIGSVVAGIPAYGLVWHSFLAPPESARANRSTLVYELEWLSLSLQYQLADATNVIGETVLTRFGSGFVLFDKAIPLDIVYDILPGWEVDFSWLVTP